MVYRVTNQAQQQTALNNVFRLSEDLFNTSNTISSGKRISRPSDDPSGTRETLDLRTSLRTTEQFIRNINSIKSFSGRSEAPLEQINNILIRANELATAQISGSANTETRAIVASEVDQLISEVLQLANTKIGNRFAFSGSKATTEPFNQSASGAVYLGNTESITVEIGKNINLQINVPGSDFLCTDLNPILSTSTSVQDLNGGSGIAAGSFTITDQAGNIGAVGISASMTIKDVITSINAAGTNITASINTAKNGITLTDSSSIVTQALTVVEVGSGNTATTLGILGHRNGTLQGLDLDPRLSFSTLISELDGGQGLALSSVNIVNGAASGTVSFSSSTTVGDVLDIINESGLNVTAGISNQGNSLRVISNTSTTTAVVREAGTGATAEHLGLGGGRNIISTLIGLKDALNNDDSVALIAMLDNLDTGLQSLGRARASFGSITRRLDNNSFALEQEKVDGANELSNIEEIDFVEKASELAALELAFQATLNTTSRIIQPSILDFLA